MTNYLYNDEELDLIADAIDDYLLSLETRLKNGDYEGDEEGVQDKIDKLRDLYSRVTAD